MFKIIEEASVKIKVPVESKISKKLPIFYNPVMKFNRDISIMLINSLNKKDLQIALPLAGSGIRGFRFLKELKKSKIKILFMNDLKNNFFQVIKENFELNNLKPSSEVILSSEDANLFMLKSSGFDYIDLDPFGTPNPFLDNAITRLSRGGILAVTATDTSALSGTYENACKRKYWAIPLRNELKHEIGLRILIRKVQLIGAQNDKALTPIFSYSRDHYFRVFFACEKGKEKVNDILKFHEIFNNAGPIWTGSLWDEKLTSKISKLSSDKFVSIINDECKIKTIGFYDIHVFCKKHKFAIPKYDLLFNAIKQAGFKVSRTHFSDRGIRSDINEENLIKIIKKII